MQISMKLNNVINSALRSLTETQHNRSKLDLAITELDKALKFLCAPTHSQRPNPAKFNSENKINNTLSKEEQALSASLMRVNHVGEICAQALYQGQSHSTKNPQLKTFFKHAAQEEADHLAWTAERLEQLQSRPSFFNPLWYAGAYSLGYVAGKMGDTTSLSFLSETEKQVENHLSKHLDQLPLNDSNSRSIVEQMRADEAEHRHKAEKLGATALPLPIRWGMQAMAKIMTTVAHRF